MTPIRCCPIVWLAVFAIALLPFANTQRLLALDDAKVPQTTIIEGTCFGPISYRVTAGKPLSEAEKLSLQQSVQSRLDEINARMSTYLDDSDVTRFNRSASTDWFAVEPETASVVAEALAISKKTEGAFDISVGPLVRLWKFGAGANEDEAFQMPSDADVQQALALVGYQKIEVRIEPAAMKKSVPGLEIDLSAIAKGYAVDQVAKVVVDAGIENYFVEVGEEVRAAGHHPEGRDWVCGIEKPIEEVRAIALRVPLKNAAIATSGDYRQYRIVAGRRLTHTIDPRTGQPTDHGVALASVQATNCMDADAFATAMMVLGKDEAVKLAEREQLGLHLAIRSDVGALTSITNERYPTQTGGNKSANLGWIVPAGISLLIFGIAIALMSVGVMFKREPIKGSCGGLANMPGSEGSACELCSNPSKECRELGLGAKKAREEREAAEAANRNADA